jgi:hypothetical protein
MSDSNVQQLISIVSFSIIYFPFFLTILTINNRQMFVFGQILILFKYAVIFSSSFHELGCVNIL